MAISVRSPEDVVNVALTRIGMVRRVANLYDGSLLADLALNIYGQTRDELMRQGDWGFAERSAVLTLLKAAPTAGYVLPGDWVPATYPAPPWLYEYTYPDDCLKVRTLKSIVTTIPNFDPQPNVYSVANDNAYTPARKVILTNLADAMMVYTGQVTDPLVWEADFVEAVAAALALRLAEGLKGIDVTKFEGADAAFAMHVAESEQG